jgi:hypothetical protein
MPKVTKKQQNASLDFSKAKTKLGRKAAPSNATSTAFKARSVALPMQGVSRDREHDEGKWKGKSIADLVAGTRHYAAGVRKGEWAQERARRQGAAAARRGKVRAARRV